MHLQEEALHAARSVPRPRQNLGRCVFVPSKQLRWSAYTLTELLRATVAPTHRPREMAHSSRPSTTRSDAMSLGAIPTRDRIPAGGRLRQGGDRAEAYGRPVRKGRPALAGLPSYLAVRGSERTEPPGRPSHATGR